MFWKIGDLFVYYSKKQVSKWNNTLDGQRKAKLEAKEKREEKEEEIRKKEDIAEAIYQAEQRRIAIEHAKTVTFAHTDRVKDFHGALILTEVLKVPVKIKRWILICSRSAKHKSS